MNKLKDMTINTPNTTSSDIKSNENNAYLHVLVVPGLDCYYYSGPFLPNPEILVKSPKIIKIKMIIKLKI